MDEESTALVVSPLTIINRAVELKMGADEIGKLVALHQGMEDRSARAQFQRAMVKCQQELPRNFFTRESAK